MDTNFKTQNKDGEEEKEKEVAVMEPDPDTREDTAVASTSRVAEDMDVGVTRATTKRPREESRRSKPGPASSKTRSLPVSPALRRRGASRAARITSERSASSIESDEVEEVSDTDVMSDTNSAKRGRGRPPTTGGYYVKQAKLEAAKVRKEVEDLKKALDPTADPKVAISRRTLEMAEELEEEMTMAPTPDIFAQIFEKVREIQKISGSSKNLKGTYKMAFLDASCIIQAAARVLSYRAQLSQSERAEEIAALRREVNALRN